MKTMTKTTKTTKLDKGIEAVLNNLRGGFLREVSRVVASEMSLYTVVFDGALATISRGTTIVSTTTMDAAGIAFAVKALAADLERI